MSAALPATGGGPAMANIAGQPSSIDEMVGSIVARGEATRKVVETMEILASGKAGLVGRVTIDDLFNLEAAVLGSALSRGKEAIDDLTHHLFSDGVYIREMVIPENHLLTGAIHKTSHLSVLAAGDISILTVEGVKRMAAPFVVNTTPGVKRIGFAHRHTVWMDIHPNPTNERDPEKLWDMFYHNIKPSE